jgi:HAMP domain-containing protein
MAKILQKTLIRTRKQIARAKQKLKYSKAQEDINQARDELRRLEGKKVRIQQQLLFNEFNKES